MRFRFAALLLLVLTVFSACNKAPDHVSYVPKDAAAVLGLNTNELGKKIAWDAIWGSKLLDEMKKGGIDTGIFKDMSQSGIRGMSTYYVYMKADKRFESGNKLVAVLPVEDAGKWEAYIKKIMPQVSVTQAKDRKEAFLGNSVYAGWSKDILIVMNVAYQQTDNTSLEGVDLSDPEAIDSLVNQMNANRKPDEAAMTAEMDKAFTTSKDNSIAGIKHFNDLEKKGHDISLWINYEVLMSQYPAAGMPGGLVMNNGLWKDAAVAMGIDFEKGSIKGNALYYISSELKDIFKESLKDNADKDMIERTPAAGLNLLAAGHIAPKAINMMLEKMGATGIANTMLAEKNLTVQYILDAFGGDMVVALNNFTMNAATIKADSLFPGQQELHTTKSDIDFIYAMKIGKKENFDRLLQMAVTESMLVKQAEGHYILSMGATPTYITVNAKEMVVSNKAVLADDYLQGKFKNGGESHAAKFVKGYPFAAYFDVKTMFQNIDPVVVAGDDAENARRMELSKALLSEVTFNGGKFEGDAFEYNISVNFQNKEENSLLILMDYATKMAKTPDAQTVAYK